MTFWVMTYTHIIFCGVGNLFWDKIDYFQRLLENDKYIEFYVWHSYAELIKSKQVRQVNKLCIFKLDSVKYMIGNNLWMKMTKDDISQN